MLPRFARRYLAFLVAAVEQPHQRSIHVGPPRYCRSIAS